jgi:YVTN family beta-propeller protein
LFGPRLEAAVLGFCCALRDSCRDTEQKTETVTFLFTDVEGSTRLLQRLGERYGEVLAEHQRLLREAFSRHGGREIDTQGDSFFVAFASAGDAVLAGVDAQRALAGHPWPDEVPVRVRIGIHTGRATLRDDRYLGVSVHRAARIAAAGHGGQIVLSEATRRLLEDEDVEGLEFGDLGVQTLKDFDRPVRVYQVVGEGLERDFGPLRTALRRHRRWIAIAATAAVAAIAVALFAARNSGGGAVSVVPNGVGMLENSKLVAADSVGASPSDVATTSDSAWVTSTDGQTVAQIDLDTGHVRQTIPVGSGAGGVAADEHAVWVANSLAGDVTWIDPKAANPVLDKIAVGTAPVGLALDGDTLWVVSKDDQTLARVDARSGEVTKRIAVGAAPRAVAVGAGSVWVVDELRNAVFRIDPRPKRPRIVAQINIGTGPVSVVFGAGSVWVANNLDGTVSRIDAARNVVAETIAVGDGPRGLAVTSEGIWVSNEFDGTLRLIDPRTNTVKRTVRIGERPQGLAAGATKLIVAIRPASDAHRGGTLRVGAPGIAPSLDTLLGTPATRSTNDGLVGFRRVGGADGGQLVPDLAVTLPPATDGGRTYSFRLRPGIRYSNGRMLQPADFRRSLERQLLVGKDALYYSAIIGAKECVAKPARCDLSRGIVTDNRAGTVTFHLLGPDPDFLYALALPFAYAVPADTPARDVGSHPIPATGPYMVGSFDRNRLTLVRNPYFREWSKAAQPDGYPDKILVTTAPKAKQVHAAERGELDLAFDVPPALQREAKTRYASQLHVNPLHGVTYLFMNSQVPPFDDVRVRRAVNYAADRAAAVRISARAVAADPTCQVLPPAFPGYEPYCPYTMRGHGSWKAPDLARARRLVAASGTQGSLITVQVPDNHRGEESFIAALFRSLGYRAQVKKVSDRAYYTLLNSRGPEKNRLQAGPVSWFADFPAASNYIATFFSCSSPANFSAFCDRSIERQIRRARALQTTDPYLANRLWAKIDRRIVDRATVAPLVTFKEIDIVSPRVGNYQYNPQWGVLSDQIWVR